AGDRTGERQDELLRRARSATELGEGHAAECFEPDLRAAAIQAADDRVSELVAHYADEHDQDPRHHPQVEPPAHVCAEHDRAEEEPGVDGDRERPDLEAEHAGECTRARSLAQPTLTPPVRAST